MVTDSKQSNTQNMNESGETAVATLRVQVYLI